MLIIKNLYLCYLDSYSSPTKEELSLDLQKGGHKLVLI